ncbi:MAG: hypothetical protein AB8G05_24870 [Oligoflexales bacterium]
MNNRDQNKKPKLIHALQLKCVLCGKEPLLQKGSWFHFRQGCKACAYRYEREVGYFSGAAWVIGYGFIGFSALCCGLLGLFLFPSFSSYSLLGFTSMGSILAAIAFFPYSRSLWMFIDHSLHPLNPSERYLQEEP